MGQSRRELSFKEEKRKKIFESTCEEMKKAGYEKKDLTISVLMANILAIIVMLPFTIFFMYLYISINDVISLSIRFDLVSTFKIILVVIGFAAIHELIHGITWASFLKYDFSTISYGVIWKYLTPYCTCDKPLKKWQYLIGGAMPTLILGFGLGIISIIFNYTALFFLSIAMILGGGGDFLIIIKLLCYKELREDTLYYDHPYECGVVVFEKNV